MRGAFARFACCRRFQPPASSPQPSESDREALRLKIRLARRKQTIPRRSNREKDACFSAVDAPLQLQPQESKAGQKAKSAPRKVFRLETVAIVYFL
jgi:hypothetical protein